MLQLFNTLGKRIEPFRPVNRDLVTIFTCGPSVYQRSHIGNFRTFLFEDILVRYLEFQGYKVRRGMNFTDIEDKAYKASREQNTTIRALTDKNIRSFSNEMEILHMKIPDYLPRASEHVDRAVEIIRQLLAEEVAYWHKGNVYFDPLKAPGFGRLYGLDMSKWPEKKRRFHKDTYPGMRWNLGDFILWHGSPQGAWDTAIGRGRPSWNIQDPAMISDCFDETLSIYAGGIDNLFRHHDYTLAILESVRPYPMAHHWLHCRHLYVNGSKMSKSKGNILYIDTLKQRGYSVMEIRFFLIYGHYRDRLNYADNVLQVAADRLKRFRASIRGIEKQAGPAPSPCALAGRIEKAFTAGMDRDLNVKAAFDGVQEILESSSGTALTPGEAASTVAALKRIDEVLKVI